MALAGVIVVTLLWMRCCIAWGVQKQGLSEYSSEILFSSADIHKVCVRVSLLILNNLADSSLEVFIEFKFSLRI